MKKRIGAIFLLIVVLVSCFSVAASADTKKGVLHAHDKWVMDVNSLTLNFKSTYNDCTSGTCLTGIEKLGTGAATHYTRVTNNQNGATSGKVGATRGKNAVAKVKGNWAGDATATIWNNLK